MFNSPGEGYTMNLPFTEKAIQQIKFESELDQHFGEHIAKMAYGEKLFSCIQCGTCSATCPLSTYMDYTPRQIIAMVRAGFKEEALTNRTIWLCASCYSCTVECPKGIKITDVMYALKREAMNQKIYPKRFNIPIFSRSFYNQVRSTGRLSEIPLMIRYYLSTNIFKSIGQISLAARLFFAGRLVLFEHGVKRKDQLKAIMNVDDRKARVKA